MQVNLRHDTVKLLKNASQHYAKRFLKKPSVAMLANVVIIDALTIDKDLAGDKFLEHIKYATGLRFPSK